MTLAASYIDLSFRMEEPPGELDVPDPPFQHELGVAVDYPAALSGDVEPAVAVDVVELGRLTGRVLVLGNGGAGKTSLMARLWREAKDGGQLAVWVNLRAWREALPDHRAWPHEDVDRAATLLGDLGHPRVTSSELDLLEPSARPLLLIDGINEVPNHVAETIIGTVDYLARRHPQATVVVTDRLVRRSAVSDRWRLVRLLAVRVQDQPVAEDPLLRNAFFLNLRLQDGADVPLASATSDDYLARHVGLDADEIVAVQHAAADAYAESGSRTFALNRFAKLAGAEVVDRLAAADVLDVDGPRARFSHQLVHDWLAAAWLAGDEQRWTKTSFDALTFRGSSFDVLAFALDDVIDRDRVDRLIRRVYDWSYYGAAYTLARARALGQTRVSATMHIALLAMLGERQWDPVVATVDRVQDALRTVGDEVAERMLRAKDAAEVRRIVSEVSIGDDLFERWRTLFLLEDRAPVTAELFDALDDAESLIGWTAANVLRRASPTGDDVAAIAQRLTAKDSVEDVVRWRAAHVLGGWSHPIGQRALLAAMLDDPDAWTRYGAIRSVVDNAADDESHRRRLLATVVESLPRLRSGPPQVLIELERSLMRSPAPMGWRAEVAPLVELAYATAVDEDDAQRWRRLAGDLVRASCNP